MLQFFFLISFFLSFFLLLSLSLFLSIFVHSSSSFLRLSHLSSIPFAIFQIRLSNSSIRYTCTNTHIRVLSLPPPLSLSLSYTYILLSTPYQLSRQRHPKCILDEFYALSAVVRLVHFFSLLLLLITFPMHSSSLEQHSWKRTFYSSILWGWCTSRALELSP